MIESNGKWYDSMEKMFEAWDKERSFLSKFIDSKFPEGIADYRATYSMTHPWKIIEYIYRHIRYAWQRVFKGYDERVIWGIDFYLAEMMPIWISELKKCKHGIPIQMFENNSFDENMNYSDIVEQQAEEKYDNILEQISDGFKAYIAMDDIKFNTPKYKELEKKFSTGLDLFKEHYYTLND